MHFRTALRTATVAALALCFIAAQPQSAPAPTPTAAPAGAAATSAPSRLNMLQAALSRDTVEIKTATVKLLDAQAAKHIGAPLHARLQAALAQPIPPADQPGYMEKPDLTLLNPGHYAGDPVCFINGIATPRPLAESEAAALSTRLARPVQLLYNPTAVVGDTQLARTAGITLDLVECLDQRTWPLQKPKPAGSLQADPVTRQMTWVLAHAPGPLTVVSHSQGCLIVRNALLIAARMEPSPAPANDLTRRITWIATGIPLRDEEIVPRPRHLLILAHAADPIAQTLGLRLDPSDFTQQKMTAHYFAAYLDEIDPSKVP